MSNGELIPFVMFIYIMMQFVMYTKSLSKLCYYYIKCLKYKSILHLYINIQFDIFILYIKYK